MPTSPLLPLAALAAGAYWLTTRGKKTPLPMTTSPPASASGRVWQTRMISNTGGGAAQRIVSQMWAPVGLFGNQAPVLVLTFEQKGADRDSRTLVEVGPYATASMVKAAQQDFGVAKAQ